MNGVDLFVLRASLVNILAEEERSSLTIDFDSGTIYRKNSSKLLFLETLNGKIRPPADFDSKSIDLGQFMLCAYMCRKNIRESIYVDFYVKLANEFLKESVIKSGIEGYSFSQFVRSSGRIFASLFLDISEVAPVEKDVAFVDSVLLGGDEKNSLKFTDTWIKFGEDEDDASTGDKLLYSCLVARLLHFKYGLNFYDFACRFRSLIANRAVPELSCSGRGTIFAIRRISGVMFNVIGGGGGGDGDDETSSSSSSTGFKVSGNDFLSSPWFSTVSLISKDINCPGASSLDAYSFVCDPPLIAKFPSDTKLIGGNRTFETIHSDRILFSFGAFHMFRKGGEIFFDDWTIKVPLLAARDCEVIFKKISNRSVLVWRSSEFADEAFVTDGQKFVKVFTFTPRPYKIEAKRVSLKSVSPFANAFKVSRRGIVSIVDGEKIQIGNPEKSLTLLSPVLSEYGDSLRFGNISLEKNPH